MQTRAWSTTWSWRTRSGCRGTACESAPTLTLSGMAPGRGPSLPPQRTAGWLADWCCGGWVVLRFGAKGELEGVLSADLMERLMDELEKAQGTGGPASQPAGPRSGRQEGGSTGDVTRVDGRPSVCVQRWS